MWKSELNILVYKNDRIIPAHSDKSVTEVFSVTVIILFMLLCDKMCMAYQQSDWVCEVIVVMWYFFLSDKCIEVIHSK